MASCPLCRLEIAARSGRLVEVATSEGGYELLEAEGGDAQPAPRGEASASSSAVAAQPLALTSGDLALEFVPSCTQAQLDSISLPPEAYQWNPDYMAMFQHLPPAALWSYMAEHKRPSSKLRELA